jgi:CheY-like chemotaxis protein
MDAAQMSRVVENIVLNGSQAMSGGGLVAVKGHNVMIDAQESAHSGPHVKVSFQDCGTGIAPEDIERVFTPYFSTRKDTKGMGLAIAHSIVARHQGRLEVSSTGDKGTSFTMWLPALPLHVLAPKDQGTGEIAGTVSTLRILVMDDDRMVLRALDRMLRRQGHETHLTRDGGEAVEAYRVAIESDSPFDYAILDLTIEAGMGGKQAAELLLQLDSDAKLIVASGYSHDHIMANYEAYGFVGALPKPISMNALAVLLAKLTAT